MEYAKYKLQTVFNVEKIVTVHYFELSKNFHYPAETHDFWEFHYVDRGQATSLSDGQEIPLMPGEITFHKPMSVHQILTDGTIAPNVCVVSFVCKPKQIPSLEKRKFRLNREECQLIKKFLTEASHAFDITKSDPSAHALTVKANPPEGTLQMMKIHLEELLISLQRQYSSPDIKPRAFSLAEDYSDTLVNDMIAFMQENITENLSIADYCEKFNYSKTLLCTRFASVTGKTINQYFIELKIAMAKRIIREKQQNRELFCRISDYLNFSSPSYFYYTFKRITNMTPSEYAQSVRRYDLEE
jgi:AraC-like DNA-binding protein